MPMPTFDLTAGHRARAIARDPVAVQPIFDPTDPRCQRRGADPASRPPTLAPETGAPSPLERAGGDGSR